MKSAGVGGGGGGGRRSEREDTGGQLLKELEALSQALYNAGGQRQQHAGPPAPSRMESWSSGSSSRSDEEPPQSPYNLGPGSRRREVITPPSPGLRLGTTTRHEQVATAPPPRSPFLSSVSSRQDHQLPRSPYQLRARNVVDVSPKSPFLGSSTVRDGDKFASPYLGARRDSLAEPPSPQLGAVKRDGAPSPYLGTRRDQEPPPSSPYVGARSRDPEPPSSPYLGGARSRDPEPPSSPYLGGARSRDPEPPSSPYLGAAPRRDPEPPLSPYLGAALRRDQEPPASPYLGARRDHLQEPSSSPYLGSRRGEQRYSPSFHGSARMEPKSPFLGTIEESGTAASPYLAVRNGFRSSSFSPGGQEVRSPHMLQQQGRSDSMLPPLRALSESFPRPPGAGGLTPLMLSSAAADAALGSPAKTRTLSIDRGFSSPSPVRVAAPAPSPTSSTKRSETYRLDAPRRATSLNPRELEEQGEREEEGQQQGYALLQPWHSQGFERNLPEVTNFPAWLEDNLQFSQKLEAPPKEKKGFWNWKPFRAIARIAQHRFHCVFTMHVHGIEGLPATMNGLRLSVSWKRKEAMTQTVPSRVFQGSAEFEETLSLKSTIYGSKSGSGDIKYEPKNFDLAVIALDIDSLVLGTHRLDLTRLLPANPEKNSTTLDDEEKRWITSFKLAGKAKGGTLVVTFGYQLLLGKDSQQLLSSSLLSSRYMDSSPLMKPLLRSYNSLPNSPQGLSVPHHHHHHAGRSSDAQFSPAMSEPPSMDYEYMMGMEHLNLDESSEKPYMLGRNALRAYSRPESLQAFRDSGLLSSSSTIPSFFSHTTDSTLTPPTPPRFASADEQPAAATTPPQERSKQEARMQPRDDEAEEEELVEEDDDNEGGDEFVVVDRGLENGTMLQHFSSQGFGDIEAAEDMVRMDDEEQEEVDEEEICDEQQEEEEEEQIAEDPAEIGEEQEVVINVDSLTREERSRPAAGEMEITADTSRKAESWEELCTGGWEEEDNSNSSPKEESLTGQDSSEEAGNGGGAAAALEILDHVEEEDRYREIPGIDDGEMQELLDVMDAHGEECGKGDERSRNVEFLIQENENENNVARITRQQDCMQSPISILQEETTSRQGTSWAEEEEEEENDDDDDDNDKMDKREKSTHHKKLDETATKNREHAGLEEEEEEEEENDDDDDDDEMDKREKREKSTHHKKLDETATKNREHAGLEEEEEEEEEENDDDDEMDKREKREKREKSTHHKKLDEIETKNREHAGLEEEEEAEEEVQKAKQEAKRSIILNSDDEIDLVAGEFLNLLEKEGELSAAAGLMSSDSEADSPRAQVLKQFEQEALIEGRIGLGFNLTEDSFEHSHNGSLHNNRNLEMGAPDNHAHSMNKPSSHVGNLSPSGWSSEEDLELVAIMEAAELELQKAIQMMRSKTRARALEDEETEALMNEWGLNTKEAVMKGVRD
ncbi:hypothetical protein BDL97_06G078500 [Sphagnum fallax]|nr:hypothetical protein BDL97_06G078500 [Sphagnum fallax]